jgi:hypothetical protein
VDEDYVALATSCGVGACGATGVVECRAGVLLDSCQPGTPAPSDSLCNGLDDDCDGAVDEDYVALATSCGVGACGATGAISCLAGVLVDSCQPRAAAPDDVLCNGLDDDCDGGVDEDWSPGSCLTGGSGICAAGTTQCQGGAELCISDQSPVAEVCDDGLDNDCDGAADFPLDSECQAPPPVSFRVPVSAGRDDVEERVSSGNVSRGSRDLEMTEDAELQVLGVRFQNVDIPREAVIQEARIQFTSDRSGSVATSLLIEGDASDDSPVFSKSAGDVTSRPRTSQAAAWDPAPWTKSGLAGPEQRTPDLVAVVQEIVDRPGWSAGNAMAFIISGSGQRVAESYDGMPEGAAVLEVDYTAFCQSDADADGFVCEVDCDDGDALVHPGADELCDGRDNDCNGSIDEKGAVDAGRWFPDEDGDGHGDAGRGENSCRQPLGWVAEAGDCDDLQASVHPGAADPCDGLDNDCDGAVDEDHVALATECGVGACRAQGVLECVAGALVDSCQAGAPAPDDALCNGLDDDCDGDLDEDFVSATTECGAGACGASGSTSCVAGVLVDSCQPGAPTGQSEALCNGLDDDCDGDLDEDFPSLPCATGQPGICGGGSTTCQAGIELCAPDAAPAASDSLCNGLDDDCDGTVDEDFFPQSCATGQLGICGLGSSSCQAGAELCVGDTLPADVDATCDGLDDDCDGLVDEDFASQATACGVGSCGATGVTACLAGTLVDSCHPGVPAANDAICNGLDDDCDGAVDEDYGIRGTSCGLGACAAGGTLECLAGTLVDSCQPGVAAADDAVCNGLDDDCDGSVDEDYVAPTTSCGQGACSTQGALRCIAGALVDSCLPGVPAANDSACNGLDDDCDGSVDEDYAASATSCGQGACAAGGALECRAGALVDSCQPGPPAGSDSVCDGLDDDCDGAVDEEFAPQSCVTSLPGVCAAGTTLCQGGAELCISDRGPGPEVCGDGLDNDCDGTTDCPGDA